MCCNGTRKRKISGELCWEVLKSAVCVGVGGGGHAHGDYFEGIDERPMHQRKTDKATGKVQGLG